MISVSPLRSPQPSTAAQNGLIAAGVGHVERELEDLQTARGVGLDAELGRDLGDPPRQREVAAGHAADVVAVQVDVTTCG